MTLIKDIWCGGHLEGSGCKPVLNSIIYIYIYYAIPYSIIHCPKYDARPSCRLSCQYWGQDRRNGGGEAALKGRRWYRGGAAPSIIISMQSCFNFLSSNTHDVIVSKGGHTMPAASHYAWAYIRWTPPPPHLTDSHL